MLDKSADITIFGLSILFVVSFYRARINAERHGYWQRRARGWAGTLSVNSGFLPHMSADTNAGSLFFLALAGTLLIAIIRTVSDGPVGLPLS